MFKYLYNSEVVFSVQIIAAADAKRLNAVEFNSEDIESTAKAIGNASKAVVSIGPTEDGYASVFHLHMHIY